MNHPETTLSAVDNLATRLGLAFDPLAPGALPEFFFAGARRRFVVQQIVHALYFSDGMVLLSGERGAGKTRVAEEVCRELLDLASICRIDATVLMDAAALRQQVADALELPTAEDNPQLLAALAEARESDAQPMVLVVDDAQLLSVPDLAECEQLVRGSGGRLRLLLVGEPELLAAWEQLGPAPIEQIDLPALQAREVVDYLRTRLQAAGYREEVPLSEVQLQELMRHSRGNIGEIHEMAQLLLGGGGGNSTAAPAGRTSAPARKLPWLPIGGAVALLTVLLLGVLYRGSDKADAPSDRVALPVPLGGAGQASPVPSEAAGAVPENAGDRQSIALPAPVRTEATEQVGDAQAAHAAMEYSDPINRAPASSAPVAGAVHPAMATQNPAVAPQNEVAQVQRVAMPAVAPQPVAPEASKPAQPVKPAQAKPAPAKQPAKTVAQHDSAPAAHPVAKSASATKPVSAAKTASSAKPAASTQQTASAKSTTSTTKTASSTKSAPSPKPTTEPVTSTASAKATQPAKSEASALSADERHLMSLPSQQFVVQLMAGYSRDKVTGFIGNAGRGVKVYYFETQLQGKPWYVAVTGPYADRGAASAAIAKLAPALRNEKPWPRGVATIQSDLRTHGGH